nr:immunoglobulin light chain junction region [Macaca mulatta]MOX14302.1 immunoglobulin light chain junction region [Macaca mulatta]
DYYCQVWGMSPDHPYIF